MTTDNGRKVAWNSTAGLKAANFMVDAMMKYGGPAKLTKLPTDPISGKLGMWMEGSFWISYLKDTKAMKKYEFDAAAPPRPSGLENETVTWAGGYSLAIPEGAKHPKEAWEFIKYYTMNKKNQTLIGSMTGQIPALKDAAYDEKFLASHNTTKTFVNLLQKSRYRTVLPCGEQLWKLYNDDLMSYLTTGKKGPSDALSYTAKEAQKVLDRAWARARRK
jgi:multiple sugar transport system substrate-binding protein